MPPSVYPTGVTIYHPDKCWGGYTLIPASARSTARGANLIDMNCVGLRELPERT